MSERDRPSAERLTEAFAEPYRSAVQGAVDAQQRNVRLAQGWVEGLTGVLESQAEANRALAKAMESYVGVVEEAVQSQERTSRALTESLESYKEVLEKTNALQESSADLLRGFFGGVTGDLRETMENSQAVARGIAKGSERQMETFRRMIAEAAESYASLMNAPLDLYQKNLETFRRQDR